MKPRNGTPAPKRDVVRAVLALAFVLYVVVSAVFGHGARAAETGLVSRGDAAVTGFSGATQPGKPPVNVQPLDVTFIDTAAASLKLFDLARVGRTPSGPVEAAAKLTIKADDIGQVFGVAIGEAAPGNPLDIYAAATSLFGLNIVSVDAKGQQIRLVKGSANARWMPGQFGLTRGGGPGSVWKIDGTTGAVSLFSTITSGNAENAGASLGGLAFDPQSHQLFVANLETGLIHRLDMNGREIDVFDHGLTARAKAGLPQVADDPSRRMDIHSAAFSSEDSSTWGYADSKRRVQALAIEHGRLYYSVGEGPTVWSVGLLSDGGFGDDPRFEIDVTGTPRNNTITALAFDSSGHLYISQRGQPAGSYDYATLAGSGASVVYRYTWDETDKHWKEEPEEYAIGMEAPHRSTNGGLALSYGYDGTSGFDAGRCRDTLWTTGDSLSEGVNPSGIDGLQGGATSAAVPATISRPRSGTAALQGSFGMIESDLKAPANSWFVDYGGASHKDRSTQGPIGGVAIYAPCDQQSSAEPPRPLVPAIPAPPPVPGVAIAKACLPGPLGGIISCRITLTNTGFTLAGPVGFSDASTILAGPAKGAAVLITGASPDAADWSCTPTPISAFACSLPALGLAPLASRFVDVLVDTGPLVAAGNSGFRNCASLDLPWSGTACAESHTQIAVKKTAPASCLPGAACTFSLTISNAGAAPFAGSVLLSDSMFVDGGGAPIAAPITAIVPPLGCPAEPAALPFSCVAPMNLLAGQSKVFSLTATMPAAPPNYWAQNCLAASASGQPAPALPPPAGSDVAATSCAWVAIGAPPPLANLRLGKSPLLCHKQGPDTVRCSYEITLENTGPSPSSVPVSFTETVPVAATLASIGAPWTCAGGPPAYACSTLAAPVIAPGAKLTIPVAIDLDRAPLEAAKCWAPNKVTLTAPPVGAGNFDGTDDAATATADAAWIRFDEGGPLELVLCDPTNLQTKKVANGDCDESIKGTTCSYTVTVTNTGPDPFKGQIDIKDEFGVAPTKVDFGAGWDCGGAGATRICSHAPLALAKGDSVALTLTATVPKSSACTLRNTATMVFPPAHTRWNGDGADDSATAFANIPSPDCDRKPDCEKPGPGEMRTASGACACERGYARDRDGICVQVRADDTPPREASPKCEPGANEYRTSAGDCTCKTGFSRDDGRCVASRPDPGDVCNPGPNELRTSKNQCVCRDGYDRDNNGRCMPTKPDKPDRCPSGTSGTPPKCKQNVCDEGETGTWPNCRPITCPEGFTGRPPLCSPKACPTGTTGTPPNCKPIDKPRCPLGQIGMPPNCRPMTCPPGTAGVPPLCKPIRCPSGTTGTPPNCKKVEAPKCPEGYRGTPPKCLKIEIKCPSGQIRDRKSGACIGPPKQEPKGPSSTPIR